MSINGCSWNSCICLLTADRLDGNWTYVGPVVYSGFTEKGVQGGIRSFDKTDYGEVTGRDTLDEKFIRASYSEKDNGTACTPTTWNKGYGAHAIDACVFYDETGKLWFSYGSWSGGIYIFELEETTGFRKNTTEAKANYDDAYMGKKLGGSSASGEASYIEYINGYYYLFISYGGLVANGGYQMRIFRSKNPDGPYTDVSGDLAIAGGTVNGSIGTRLMSYYKWSWWDYAHVAQGHNSAFVDDDGKAYVIYHTRTNDGTEGHSVRVHQLFTSENGYLVTSPFEYTATDSVENNGYTVDEIAGTYEILFQRNTNSDSLEYNKPQEITLSADGKITGEVTGTWTAKTNSPLVSMEIGGIVYEGTFIKQNIEGTNAQTLCFTTVGTNDICLWGAKYPSDDVAVAMTANKITLPKIITNDINLETKGLFGAVIEWEGNSSLLSDGTVIPPVVDRSCTITATITKGNYVYHKKFETTIMSEAGDSARKVASYFDIEPLELSNDNIKSFENPLYGMNIKNGVTIKFTAKRTAVAGPLAAIFAFNIDSTGDADGGRLYMTDCTYLGYNSDGFYDANLKDYALVKDYIGDGTTDIEIKLMPNGYSVYAGGTLAYSNETVANGTTPGINNLTDYSKVLNFLSKTATHINFGTGTWGTWRDQGSFNGTISNFEIWAEPVKESSLGSNYYYYQDYEDVASESELAWDNGNVVKALGTDKTKYAKLTPSGSGSRGSINSFGLDNALSGEFFITEDILFKSSVTYDADNQIAIVATDRKYSSNNTNIGIESGYILKLSANGKGNQTFNINDTSDTVNIPSDKWVNIRLDMDSSDLTKAILTITNINTNEAIISEKQIAVNGSGDISGANAGSYVLLGRGNSVACIDNIVIGKPGVANYEGLDKAIKSGEKYIKLSDIQQTYTDASMNVLKNAVEAAKAIDRSLPEEEQVTIDNAEIAITNAIKSLECAIHEYINTEYIKMPTCTETGRAKQICCLCGKAETEREADVDALGHIAGEWEIITPPTTASEGQKVKKCTRCSEIVKTASIEKLPEPTDPPAVTDPPEPTDPPVVTDPPEPTDPPVVPETKYTLSYTTDPDTFKNAIVLLDKTKLGKDETATLTIKPETGYEFKDGTGISVVKTSGTCTIGSQEKNSDGSYSYKISGLGTDCTVTVSAIAVPVAVTPAGEFLVTYNSTVNNAAVSLAKDGKAFESGSRVTATDKIQLSVTPGKGFTFADAPVVTAGNATVNIAEVTDGVYTYVILNFKSDTNIKVTGNAVPVQYSVNIQDNVKETASANNVKLSLSTTDASVGSTVQFIITPEEGFQIKSAGITAKENTCAISGSEKGANGTWIFNLSKFNGNTIISHLNIETTKTQVAESGTDTSVNIGAANLGETDFADKNISDAIISAITSKENIDIIDSQTSVKLDGAKLDSAVDEINKALNQNNNVNVFVEVNEETNLDSALGGVAEDAFLNEVKSQASKDTNNNIRNSKIAMPLDISFYAAVNGVESKIKISIKDTGNREITISMSVPSHIEKESAGIERLYYAVRFHNGNKTIIPCDYNSASGKIKFKSSKFSTYVLCYVDTSKGTQTAPPVYPGGGSSYIPGPAATTTPGTTNTPAPSLVPSSVPVLTPTPVPTAEPVPTTEPVPTQTPAIPQETGIPEKSPEPGGTSKTVKTGDKFVVNNLKYTVTSVTGTRSVKFTGVKKKVKKIIIPASIKLSGNKYKVTSIAKNALKGNKKLEKLSIGTNVKQIGKNAFNGCSKLKSIVIKSKKLTAKKTGSKAFKGINSKATIKVPKSRLEQYKKLVKSKGAGKNVKVKKLK